MADFHGTQEVVTDLREDGVLIMRINRPEKRNAINGQRPLPPWRTS